MGLIESGQGNAEGQFVLLHPRDNILVCTQAATAGTSISIDDKTVVLTTDIPLGHKIAREPLAPGDKVLRYGIPIGSMTTNAAPGEHIHSHNLKSDYMPAHGRDGKNLKGTHS